MESKFFALLTILWVTMLGPSIAREVCETRVCIDRAKQFLDSMDTTVDPCTDFYQFSCGQYVENNNVDQEDSVASVFTELESDMQRNLRKSITKINGSDETLPQFMRELRNFYDKCMDTNQIEEDGMTSLLTLLSFIEGESIFDPSNFTADSFNFERRAWLMTQAGVTSDFFIDLDFIPNLQNTSELIINLSHSSDIEDQELIKHVEDELIIKQVETESKEEEGEESASAELSRYIMFVLSILRDLNSKLTKKDVTNIIVLQNRLVMAAAEMIELKKNVSNLVNVMTVTELQGQFQALNWTEYIRAKSLGQINITDPDSVRVNVMEIGYLNQVMTVLKEVDPLTISLYQTLKTIVQHVDRVNKNFRNYVLTKNRTPVPNRWKKCVKDVVDEFGVGISYVYVKDYGSAELKNFSENIIMRLREQFERMMSKSQWFDQQTFEKAKEKLDAVLNQIAYSDELLNVTFVESFYKGLNFTNLSYLDSVLLLNKITYIRNIESYLDPSEFSNTLQFVEVAMVNGFYIPFSNSIQIPMGILQSKFIDLGGPLFLNYGSLGFTMAHELSHAFDDFGRQFDFKGNVANWYSDKANELNQEKEKCMVDQYNAYTDSQTKMQINGQTTLSENMADLGGILIAYYAYKSATPSQVHDLLPLPGFNYTNDQQFWLAFSTTWCSAYRESKLRSMIEYDTHAPAQYRINGALQNVHEFARDFNCPAGSPMNPTKKCNVF